MEQVDTPSRLAVLLKRRARLRRLYAHSDEQIAAELKRYSQKGTPDQDSLRGLLADEVASNTRHSTPFLDNPKMTLIWQGKRCVLGPGQSWPLMVYLLSRSGGWVEYKDLRKHVLGDAYVTDEAIRVALSRLRDRLLAAQMAPLADAICLKKLSCGFFQGGAPT